MNAMNAMEERVQELLARMGWDEVLARMGWDEVNLENMNRRTIELLARSLDGARTMRQFKKLVYLARELVACMEKERREIDPYQKVEILIGTRWILDRNLILRNEFGYHRQIMDRLFAILEEHPQLAHKKINNGVLITPFWALICYYGADVESLKDIHYLNPDAFTVDYKHSASVFHKSIGMLDIQMIDFVVTHYPAVLSIKNETPADGHLLVTFFLKAFKDRMSELDVVIMLRKMVSLYPACISELLQHALSPSYNVERIKLISSWAMSLGNAGSLTLKLPQPNPRNIDVIPHVVGVCKKIAYSIDETAVEITLSVLEAMQESTVLECLTLYRVGDGLPATRILESILLVTASHLTSLTLWIDLSPGNHYVFTNFLDGLIQQNQLQSLTVCNRTNRDYHPNLSTFESLGANTSLQEFHLTGRINFDLAVLTDILKLHNFTLKSVSIPYKYRNRKIKDKELSYYVALNRCGRRTAKDTNTSLEQFTELLCDLDNNLQNKRTDRPDDNPEGRTMSDSFFFSINCHHMIYGLLRLAPALWSRS